MKKRMISVHVKLTETEYKKLNQLSEDCQMTKSEILRQGLDYIDDTESMEEEIFHLKKEIEELESESDMHEPYRDSDHDYY